MNKKVIIGICAGAGALLILLLSIWGYHIWKNTSQARNAAEDFTNRFNQGELSALQMGYYARAEQPSQTFTNEDGIPVAAFVTDQELIDRYGEELVMAGREEEIEEHDRLFATIMKYSNAVSSVGLVLGSHANMRLTLNSPDLGTWMNELPEEELDSLIWETEDFTAELDSHMSSDTIPQKTTQLLIPMIKQNGKWRFVVSEEIENSFYGGLFDETLSSDSAE